MSNISDEVRKVADEYDVLPFYKLADRIDNEMVELPRDADGVPIHVGETLYLPSGVKVGVNRIFIGQGEPNVECIEFLKTKFLFSRHAKDFTHTTPDSWESIAQGMEDWAEDNGFYGDNDVSSFALDFADRIRKLAASEGGC